MPPKIDQEKRLEQIENAVTEVSGIYDGTALMVPSPDVVGRAMGLSRGPLFADGTTFIQKVESATGLKVIHNGLVLGIPEDYSPPSPSSETLEKLKSDIDSLPINERNRLLAWLAIHSS